MAETSDAGNNQKKEEIEQTIKDKITKGRKIMRYITYKIMDEGNKGSLNEFNPSKLEDNFNQVLFMPTTLCKYFLLEQSTHPVDP